MLFEPYVRFRILDWEITAHSAYNMFSKYKYLIVNLVFPTSGFRVGIIFLS